MSLDTLANVKSRLGIATDGDDDLLDLLRDSSDAFIANYCDRDFVANTFTEDHPGDRASIQLRNYPVATVTSVKVDRTGGFGASTTLDASSYVVDRDRGLIWSRGQPFACFDEFVTPGARAPQAVRVVYTTSAAVPHDVRQAYADLVGHWYRHVKTMIACEYQNVTQQTFGDATAIFAKDQIAGLPLPPDIVRLLAPYRNPPV